MLKQNIESVNALSDAWEELMMDAENLQDAATRLEDDESLTEGERRQLEELQATISAVRGANASRYMA